MKHFLTAGVSAAFLLLTLSLVSCDKDYTEIDSGLNIDDDDLNIEKTEFAVRAFNRPMRDVQSNKLDINPLGILRNGATFGTTHADFVTQLSVPQNTVIGKNPVIDSVALYIPYDSNKLSTDSNGNGQYSVKSIYGSQEMKLEIFESGYYINPSAPPDFTQSQPYYTSDANLFLPLLKGAYDDGTPGSNAPALNNSSRASENTRFSFSDREIYLTKVNADDNTQIDTTRLAPGMRLVLNKNYFQKKILEAPAEKLKGDAVFTEYMRGLYFKTTATSPTGSSYGLLDFSKGKIEVYYKQDKDENDATRVEKTLVISMTGNTVSLQQNEFGTDYSTAISNPNTSEGDELLYLKGGNGSIAYIKLFDDPVTPGGNPAELDRMIAEGWLINEAKITFTVDRSRMRTLLQPQRLYLYNAETNAPITDYTLDISTATDTDFNKFVYGGILSTDETSGEVTYSIRLTRHIRDLIKGNVDYGLLGLSVSDDISDITSLKGRDGTTSGELPRASVKNPFGTVLKGNTPEVKNIKFEIRYTKTK